LGKFAWKCIASSPKTPPDLQTWIRNADLDPDWLRVGTDIVGGTPPPTFNGSFSLRGSTDTTPPTITCSASPNVLWPPNHKLVPITVTVTVTDPDDPNPTSFVLQSLTSNEGNIADESQGWTPGTPSTSGFLRAERNGDGTGRVYTLTYLGKDSHGNTATCSTTVHVPHDQGQ